MLDTCVSKPVNQLYTHGLYCPNRVLFLPVPLPGLCVRTVGRSVSQLPFLSMALVFREPFHPHGAAEIDPCGQGKEARTDCRRKQSLTLSGKQSLSAG